MTMCALKINNIPSGGGQPGERTKDMKTKNLLGIKIKCNNSREENLIEIIKGQVKNFYSDFVNKPYIVEEHYNILYGQISSLLHLALINPSEFIIISDRLLTVYKFTELKSRKYK